MTTGPDGRSRGHRSAQDGARSRLAAREVAPSGPIPVTHTLPPSPLSLRMHDQEQDHQYDANAEQRVVRERKDCSKRSKHKRTGPEENGDDSPQESPGRQVLPLGRNEADLTKRDLDVMRMRYGSLVSTSARNAAASCAIAPRRPLLR